MIALLPAPVTHQEVDSPYHLVHLMVCTCVSNPLHVHAHAHPHAHAGCPVFQPPTRGAHVCLRVEEAIYCNVYCDHRFEFSDIPLNPYWCGSPTGLEWRKFPRGSKRVNDLPRCTGMTVCLYACMYTQKVFVQLH